MKKKRFYCTSQKDKTTVQHYNMYFEVVIDTKEGYSKITIVFVQSN